MVEKPKHHQAPIVRINEILPHTNADKLEIIKPTGDYQVVVRKGQFKVGDFGVYIFPDSVVAQTEPFKFIWESYVEEDGTVRPSRRRITVRKFRGEWSEGLLLPVSDFKEELQHIDWNEETDVSDLLGIHHYEPQELGNTNREFKKRKYPKTLRGWFHYILKFYWLRDLYKRFHNDSIKDLGLPVYDVEAFKNHVNAFQAGEVVVVTEKIHGSNARFTFRNGKMYAGSRKLWKTSKSKCIWRKVLEQHPWIEKWCREHPEYALYGEVVPTQKGFYYGCKEGETKFFVFDILKPDRTWMNFDEVENEFNLSQDLKDSWVPEFYKGPFNLDLIKQFVDGSSLVSDTKHIKEGIVVKPTIERHVTGLGRLQLKLVSNIFLERDGKDNEDLLS